MAQWLCTYRNVFGIQETTQVSGCGSAQRYKDVFTVLVDVTECWEETGSLYFDLMMTLAATVLPCMSVHQQCNHTYNTVKLVKKWCKAETVQQGEDIPAAFTHQVWKCVCVIDITDIFQSFQACCFSSARYLDTVTSFSISLQQCSVSHSSLIHNCSMVLGSHFLAFRTGGKLTTIPNNIKKTKSSSYSCGQFIKYISATDC